MLNRDDKINSSAESIYLGLMSGTSMDGVDAVLTDVDSQQVIVGKIFPYSAALKQSIKEFMQTSQHSLAAYYHLHRLIGQAFAQAAEAIIQQSGIPLNQVVAIGSHGQTVEHETQGLSPYTVQLGCAHTIAQHTQLPVITDFRTRDIILGGQGAPLAPLYHDVLFSEIHKPLAVVNIGGIANVSILQDNGVTLGFDTGPGNCLMDAWVFQHTQQSFDQAGTWARSGKIIVPLLNSLLTDPFFHRPTPKSIGKEYFDIPWLLKKIADKEYSAEDIQATLLALTATSIAQAIVSSHGSVTQVLVCGGGAHNSYLLETLSQHFKHIPVVSTDNVGVNPDFIEAQMMAWLAAKHVRNQAVDLRRITGAQHSAILGVFYPPGIDKTNSNAL